MAFKDKSICFYENLWYQGNDRLLWNSLHNMICTCPITQFQLKVSLDCSRKGTGIGLGTWEGNNSFSVSFTAGSTWHNNMFIRLIACNYISDSCHRVVHSVCEPSCWLTGLKNFNSNSMYFEYHILWQLSLHCLKYSNQESTVTTYFNSPNINKIDKTFLIFALASSATTVYIAINLWAATE